jgi:SAM-dependent MidA family methyltransferase
MKLTKEQESLLIGIGLQKLLEGLARKAEPKRKHIRTKKVNRPKWSASQHKKFSATMKKKWKEIRANKKTDA